MRKRAWTLALACLLAVACLANTASAFNGSVRFKEKKARVTSGACTDGTRPAFFGATVLLFSQRGPSEFSVTDEDGIVLQGNFVRRGNTVSFHASEAFFDPLTDEFLGAVSIAGKATLSGLAIRKAKVSIHATQTNTGCVSVREAKAKRSSP